MDGICTYCTDGVIEGSEGVAPITCDCRAGREVARQDTGVRIPSSVLQDRAEAEFNARMAAAGKRQCRGHHFCINWITEDQDVCSDCKRNRRHD